MLYSDVVRRGTLVSVNVPLTAHRARGPLAQLAEQQTLNLRVLGSIPRRLTTLSSALSGGAKY